MTAEVRVHELGAAFWSNALKWASRNKKLSPRDLGILETCAAIPRKMPSERQCALALSALQKMVEAGFAHPRLEGASLETA